jgi:2-succinyl-5-enolpyruvyl-6-hydroxy-3-cyclohexene-1-carboxylate synthase
MNKHYCIQQFLSPLLDYGVSTAVISPGSRNAPWIHVLSRVSGMKLYSAIDERSAAFMALGMVRKTKRPVILSCTSGSALANYYPAITEAFYARIPVIILSSDRPQEAIDQWDGQAIRQKGLFTNHVRLELEAPQRFDDAGIFAKLGEQVKNVMASTIPGPVHVNFPFPPPLYEVPQLPEASVRTNPLREKLVRIDLTGLKCRTLVVNGMPDGESEYFQFVYDEHTVVLSDVTAGQPSTVSNWDAYLYPFTRKDNRRAFPTELQPELLITTGTTVVSKGLKQLLRTLPPHRHLHLSSFDEVGDPFQSNPRIMKPTDPIDVSLGHQSANNYQENWQAVVEPRRIQLESLDWSLWNEFTAVRWISEQLNEEEVHSSSSMPIRYWSFLQKGPVHCNRGTSGIDGSLSTAVGYATQCEEQVVLIIGDLAYLYDVNGWWINPLPKNIKVIVLNNAGGGIFDLIDGPGTQSEYEHFQVTPHARSIQGISESFGLNHFTATNREELKSVWDLWKNSSFAAVLEVITDRKANKDFFNSFIQAL